jgi:hypothetical protein
MGVWNSKELLVENELTGRYEKRTPGGYYRINMCM